METCEDGDDLVFFYQVCEGIAKASHASHTAAQAGLPDQLLTRGKEVRSKGQNLHQASLPLSLLLSGVWVSGSMGFLILISGSLTQLPHLTPLLVARSQT